MVLSILTLIAGCISIALAAIVLAEGTSTRSMRIAYGMFAGSVGVWAVFLGLFLAISSDAWASIFVFFYYSMGLLIPYSFLFFSFAYLNISVTRWVRIFALLPWVAMTFLIAVPGAMVAGIDAGPAKHVDLVFLSYLLYSVVFVLYVGIGLWLLITKAARAKGAQAHRRVVAVSLFIGFAGGGYFDIILPLLGNYELIAYGPLFAFVTSAGIFYVITRHGLFDIRFTVIRTVNYILSLATLSGIYLLVAFLVLNLLLGQTSLTSQLIFNLITTILLALLFQPVKLFFDRWTNRFFYRYSYDTERVIGDLSRILTSTIDLRKLLDKIAIHLSNSLNASYVGFFVYDGDRAIQVGTPGHRRLALRDAHWLNQYVTEHGLYRALYSFDANQDKILHRFMVSYRMALIVPLIQNEEIKGYISFGEHQKSDYTSRDVRLLKTISNELIIAIENSLAIEEVKNLNATLQQRIDTATSELRRSNAQLQRLDEAKDEFMSMASHQLRTPLTSIKGYISMLVEGDAGKVSDQQKQLLQEAFNSSERMVRLINDFLNVSRLQTGKFTLDRRPTDLSALIEEEIEGLSQTAKARGISFAVSVPKRLAPVNIDEGKIRQVVMNFSDNAIYYSKESSTIKVSLKQEGDELVFKVKDTGIGVPDEEKSKLFQKFFRAGNARRSRPDGTGIGLYLAKKVIDAHHGHVLFESQEKKGSTFGFRLPLSKVKVQD